MFDHGVIAGQALGDLAAGLDDAPEGHDAFHGLALVEIGKRHLRNNLQEDCRGDGAGRLRAFRREIPIA